MARLVGWTVNADPRKVAQVLKGMGYRATGSEAADGDWIVRTNAPESSVNAAEAVVRIEPGRTIRAPRKVAARSVRPPKPPRDRTKTKIVRVGFRPTSSLGKGELRTYETEDGNMHFEFLRDK